MNAVPCPPELLIFDCDGVLVDTEPIAARSLAAAAQEEGLALSADDCLARFTGLSLDCVLAALAADLGRPLSADFRSRLEAGDRAAFAAELRAVPDVAAVIARLPFRRCVASSGTPEKIRYTLGLTGLLPLFEPHLFSAREVAAGKPAPDLFLHAAARMGVDPARCLVIEDAEPGVRAARAAGMRVFGFVGGSHRRDDVAARLAAAGAERVFFRMDELPSLLGVSQPVSADALPLSAAAQVTMMGAGKEDRRGREGVEPMAYDRVMHLALAAHTQTIKALMDHVEGKDATLPEFVADEGACRLGRWLREEGARYAALEEFREASLMHERFHLAVCEVLDLCVAGNYDEAKARLRGGSAFAQLSREMLMAFEALSTAIAAAKTRE